MKKYLLLLILYSFKGFSQTYTVKTETKGPNYNAYTGNGVTTSTSTIQQTKTAADYQKDAQNNIANSMNQASQIYAQRAAAQAIINENRRIEEERQQREYSEQLRLQELEKKKLQEEKRKEEENNPNSILSKFKNAKANKENEELKIKLMQMEEFLSEKEKAEKEKAELERLQKEKLEIERIKKEKEALKLKSKKRK